jgi:hypothetical protein
MAENDRDMSEEYFDHDSWNHSPPKLPKASKIILPGIFGVLPFDGKRNPGSRSAVSHHVWFTYRTEANQWKLKVGITDSASEFAVGLEGLLDPETYDIRFQPCVVSYYSEEDTRNVPYTHDFLITLRNGHRRLVFVRYRASLKKEKAWRHIDQIGAATLQQKIADDMIVVDADTYTRQRRENLFRMWKISEQRDPEADEQVLEAAYRCRTLWFMRDLFPLVSVSQARAFKACYRLIAQKKLQADWDNVIWEHSRVWVA